MTALPDTTPAAPALHSPPLAWRERARQGVLSSVALNAAWTLPLLVAVVIFPGYITRKTDGALSRWEAVLGQAAGLTAVCVVGQILAPYLGSRWRRFLCSPFLGVVAGAPLGLWLLLTRSVVRGDVAIYLITTMLLGVFLAVIWESTERSVAREQGKANEQPPATTP